MFKRHKKNFRSIFFYTVSNTMFCVISLWFHGSITLSIYFWTTTIYYVFCSRQFSRKVRKKKPYLIKKWKTVFQFTIFLYVPRKTILTIKKHNQAFFSIKINIVYCKYLIRFIWKKKIVRKKAAARSLNVKYENMYH